MHVNEENVPHSPWDRPADVLNINFIFQKLSDNFLEKVVGEVTFSEELHSTDYNVYVYLDVFLSFRGATLRTLMKNFFSSTQFSYIWVSILSFTCQI